MAAPLGYDLTVQQLIPGYASLARLSVALLAASPLGAPSGAPVLVAGCGTGAELVEAQAQRPDWQLWAIDPSNEMLQAAKARLGESSSAIHWQQTTVEALDADSRFCGALSVLVLQSLPDDGSKLAFLTALARSLEPGGNWCSSISWRRNALPSKDRYRQPGWASKGPVASGASTRTEPI